MRKYKHGTGNGKRWRKIILFTAILAVLSLTAGLIGIRALYEQNLKAVDPADTQNITFVIRSGDNVAIIADGLKQKNLIRSRQAFTQYVRSHELAESFKAGTYSLKKSYDVPEIVDYFVDGNVDTNLFTILPGQRLELIAQAFIEQGGYTKAEVDAALEPSQYAGHPALVDKPAGASLEGFLYPDSYEKIAETRPETIVRQSLDEMADALSPEIRAGFAAQGLSVYQGIILASIVEREVGAVDKDGNPSDNRPKAAQVFLKRLSIGMMLQSNATDNFPDTYDTYSIPGLPPGPISNVTLSSLQAVVNPADTDYLYFVAGKDCVTRFSHTVDQHETLKAQHGVAAPEDGCQG